MVKFFVFFVLFSNLFKMINSENWGLEPYKYENNKISNCGLVGIVNCDENNPFEYYSSRPIIKIGYKCNGEVLNRKDILTLIRKIVKNTRQNLLKIIKKGNICAIFEAVVLLIKKLSHSDGTIVSIIDIIYNWIGIVECNGADNCIGCKIFTAIVLGTDFSGGSVCKLCDTTCTPYGHISGPPLSLYPWGCICPETGCNEYGPINTGWGFPLTKKFCMPEYDCTEWCNSNPRSLNPVPATKYQGYICNWWNFYIGPVCILINPLFSPIRWCECCPVTEYSYGKYPSVVSGW